MKLILLKRITRTAYLMFVVLLLCIAQGYAQTARNVSGTISVTGTVMDASGPIIGANVIEKGTTNGTMTDLDGHFKLEVKAKSTLVFSFIGYVSKEVFVDKSQELTITLNENLQDLEEVVVIGYGTAKKKDLTGSVVRTDLSKTREIANVSLASALQGSVAGLNVGVSATAGSSPEMSLRGRTTINGKSSPLIVLDGMIYRGEMVDINPNDIESIDILKDASAAAIYGSEATNGVIILTTKKGKMGKPVIEYNFSYSMQKPTNTLRPGDADFFLQKMGDVKLTESRMTEKVGDVLIPLPNTKNPEWDPFTYLSEEQKIPYEQGLSYDWWDMLTNENPNIQTHDISIRGRNETSSYFISFGYLDQKNLVMNDNYKRYSGRINVDTDITDWLKVGVQSFFTLSDKSGVSPKLHDIMTVSPLNSPYEENGEYKILPNARSVNPFLAAKFEDLDKRYNLGASAFASIKLPIKGLTYKITTSQNYITDKEFRFEDYAMIKDILTNRGTKYNASKYNWAFDNILNYEHQINKHAITGTFVYGAEKFMDESTKAVGQGYSNTTLNYNSFASAKADLNTIESKASQESSLYTMLRLGYTYNDRYLFTGTIRRDGFSGFGKNNKFGYFPSVAFAWRMSEESFIKNLSDQMDNLKFRVSYGINGNRPSDRYTFLSEIERGMGYLYGDGAVAENGQWPKRLANDNLKWETTAALNIGLDFAFFNYRLTGDVNYYISNTNDMIYKVPLPKTTGYNEIMSNIGKIGNKGFEATISGIPVKTKDFIWTIDFNYSMNRNKVKSILGKNKDGVEEDLVSSKLFIGKPYGVIYDYNIIGMWQIEDAKNGSIPAGFTYGTYKIEDIDQDGKYTAAGDRKILGYEDPAYRFSIINTLSYKNWDLRIMINSIQGGKNYYWANPASSTHDIPNPDNMLRTNTYKFDYWTPENPNAKYRQIGSFNPTVGENFHPAQQRNFVRLQDVSLSYTLPKTVLGKLGVNRVKVFVSGKNLLTLTKWDGYDPELPTKNVKDTQNALDVDNDNRELRGTMTLGAYPVMRNYTFGLNIEL